MDLLVAHDWPGNVRELQHAIERAAALTPHAILAPDDVSPTLAAAVRGASAPSPASLRLQEVVTGHLRRVLKHAGWNKKRAAELLGIHRRTLYRVSKRYGTPLRTGE